LNTAQFCVQRVFANIYDASVTFNNNIKEQAVNPWLKNRPSSQKAACIGKSNTLSLSENFFEDSNYCNVDLSKPIGEY